ncbi:MAG: thiamine pyrophosphate-dependent enzyme [Terriglobia bacterium]
MLDQQTIISSGNEAAAHAIIDIGYDGEGYYPITPSSEVGEYVNRAYAQGEIDLSFVVGTSELAAISTVAGMAIAGGRAVDVTSAQGLLLKAEELPALAGLGLPVVLNLATRDVNAPLNIKNGHSDLAATLGWGWITFCAPTVQAVYDLNIIALKIAEAVSLPALIAYDGFHTSHANRRIQVFKDRQTVRDFVGAEPPRRLSILDVEHPHTFGPYMNDDLINTKVIIDQKMETALKLLPRIFDEYARMSGRRYGLLEVYGDPDADVAMVILNSAAEASKIAVDRLRDEGKSVKLVSPTLLRPWPADAILQNLFSSDRILVAERVSQYGANNYLANEIGAILQRAGDHNLILSRTYGLGGLNFYAEDAEYLFRLALNFPQVPDHEKRWKGYYQASPGDRTYLPPRKAEPISAAEATHNQGKEKIDLKELAEMPHRIDKHSACPGCGLFANLEMFLRGIDGHIVLFFNTGCGMVVTTGFPSTSFRVPYFHNLFHNASSTATGVVEMYKRYRKQGKLGEEITFIVVTGDGGDDIGMDQVIGAALRNDAMIVLEYDNKGYMNTGGQLCYTGLLGQRFTNANVGTQQKGKPQHHKDIVEILRGTHAPYLFQATVSNYRDLLMKARKAQKMVREGNFVFGRFFSPCPLNWGTDPKLGFRIADKAVKSCLFPLYEVERGVTKLNANPERSGQKLAIKELFQHMGSAFAHLASPDFAPVAEEIQMEVDRRWKRLVEMDANPLL